MIRALARLSGRGANATQLLQLHVQQEGALVPALARCLASHTEPGAQLLSSQRAFSTSSWLLQGAEAAREQEHVDKARQNHSTDTLKMKKGDREEQADRDFHDGHVEPHRGSGQSHAGDRQGTYWLHQPVYEPSYVNSIAPKHKKPELWHEKTAFWAVTAMRKSFDLVTFYGPHMTERKWLIRILFLETVAGVPGMVGAMFRHLHSLRQFRRDHGWIHTLLEEAENERMHLLTFMNLSQPGPLMRGAVLAAQGVFFNLYSLFYLISPKHCHAFVGYLEEEAVKTYTHCLADIDTNRNGMGSWATRKGPEIAIKYWDLQPEHQSLRDVVLQVRADEACHSHVNHSFSSMKTLDKNPFTGPNSHIIP